MRTPLLAKRCDSIEEACTGWALHGDSATVVVSELKDLKAMEAERSYVKRVIFRASLCDLKQLIHLSHPTESLEFLAIRNESSTAGAATQLWSHYSSVTQLNMQRKSVRKSSKCSLSTWTAALSRKSGAKFEKHKHCKTQINLWKLCSSSPVSRIHKWKNAVRLEQESARVRSALNSKHVRDRWYLEL